MNPKKLILCYLTGIFFALGYVYIVLRLQHYLVYGTITFVLIQGAVFGAVVYLKGVITVKIEPIFKEVEK